MHPEAFRIKVFHLVGISLERKINSPGEAPAAPHPLFKRTDYMCMIQVPL